MRRSSIAVLPVVVVCVIAAWTGASVLAQPHEKNPAATVHPAYRGPLRYLARGGYLPGSATRAASGAATATRPSQVLDLRDWYLTLPTGSSGLPDTVRQPQLQSYSSPFFQLDQGRDGVVCTSNAGGVTTAHSSYPRSELREMNGGEKAEWSNRRGAHTMEVRQAVTALPPVKPEVVTAQIHDAESDVIEIRLEDNRLVAQHADGKDEFVLDPAYVLGTPYDLRVVAARADRRVLQRDTGGQCARRG